MICTTYFLTFFSELIPPTGYICINLIISFSSFKLIVIHLSYSFNEVIDGLILVMIDLIDLKKIISRMH